MAIRNLFYQCVSGPHALTMDCWYLVQRPDQIYWVEHTWSHGDGPDDPDVGSCTLPVGQFVFMSDDSTALACLYAAMANEVQRTAAI